MIRFHKKYAIIAIALFILEILIALYIHDAFIRPFGGDFLVVIFMYYTIRMVLNIQPITTAVAVLIISFGIEILQYFHFVEVLGLANNKLALIILGNSFSWLDLLMYLGGIITVYLIDNRTVSTAS